MKHFLSSLLLTVGFTLMVDSAWAEGSVSSSDGNTYSTLAAAVGAVTENNTDPVTLTLNGDMEISSRLNISNRNIIIKGATGSERIVRSSSYTNDILILPQNSTTLILQDLILDGNSVNASSVALEASSGSTRLQSVTVRNHISSHKQGIICAKSNGTLVFDNTSFISNTASGVGSGIIFIGNAGVSFVGACVFTNNSADCHVYLENCNHFITATQATHATRISIYVEKNFAVGKEIVKGCNDNSKFNVANSGYYLGANGDNLAVAAITSPIWNKTTLIGYDNLPSAVNEASSGAELMLTHDIELATRVNFATMLTLDGCGHTIYRKAGNTNNIMLLAASGCNASIKDVVLDGNGIITEKSVIEASNGTLTLQAVTIQNARCMESKGQSVVVLKGSGTLIMEDVSFTDCEAASGFGTIFVGRSTLTLKGNNSFTDCPTAIYIEKDYTISSIDATNEQAISIDVANTYAIAGKVVVSGCSDPSKFSFAQPGRFLEASGSNLVIAATNSSLSLQPFKDTSLRYKKNNEGFETTRYYDAALLHFNKLGSTSKANFATLLGFDLSVVQSFSTLGFTVSDASITLTDHGTNLNTLKFYKFNEPWTETSTTNYQSVSGLNDASGIGGADDKVQSAITDANFLCSAKLMNPYKKSLFELGSDASNGGSTIQTFDIAHFQTVFTTEALTRYISSNVGSEVNFLIISDSENEATVFSKEATAAGYKIPNSEQTTTEYTWTGSAWVKGSTTVDRYAMMLRYFNMTEAEFQQAVAPKLNVTLTASDGVSYTLTISSAGVATLVLPFDAELPEGIQAYCLTADDEKIYSEELTSIIANSPAFITGEAGEYKLYAATNEVSYIETPADGSLIGTYRETTAPLSDYVLQKHEGEDPAFYKLVSGSNPTIRPFHAWLEAPASSSPARYRIDLYGTDDIEEMPVIQNNDDKTIYDLWGREVASPKHGIYIINGKRVFITSY